MKSSSSPKEAFADFRIRRESWIRWIWVIGLAALWELIRILGKVNPLLMPPLGDILAEFARLTVGGGMARRWLLSLAVVAGGLAAGVIMALGAILLSRIHRSVAALFSLLSSLMHPLPGLALLPLVILWFGTGIPAVIAIIIHAVMWPVYINLESGIRSLPEPWVLYARNLGLSPRSTFVRIDLPGSFPYLISGIRTGWARSWRAFIASEMVFGAVAAGGGLGWQLFESRVMMDTPGLYAGLLAVMITGLAVEHLFLARWEKTVRGKWGEA